MSEPGDEPAGHAWGRFLTLSPLHVDLGDVLVQVVAVALGVILGFAVTSWSESAHQRGLLRETMGNIVAELSSNQVGMRQVEAKHAQAFTAYQRLLERANASRRISFEQAKDVVTKIGFPVNIPLSIGWQIAQNDQGLTLVPYDDRYGLAWVYQLQGSYYQAEDRYRTSLLTVTESPNGNYYFQIVDLANQEQAVVLEERQLDALYTKAISGVKQKFHV